MKSFLPLNVQQTNEDRDAEIIVYNDNENVTSKKVSLKAGYGHYLADVDMSDYYELLGTGTYHTGNGNLSLMQALTLLAGNTNVLITYTFQAVAVVQYKY